MKLRCLDRVVDLARVALMGVLNVTPDSFSDGGLWLDHSTAIQHAEEMLEQGATIIDVGGESTRPGAAPVPEDEELRRVLPVVRAVARDLDAVVSIDTRKVDVARAAVEAGASVINDTLGEETDYALDELAAETGAAIVVMHSRGTPETMRSLASYDDIVGHVRDFLATRADRLRSLGVETESIALDPGIGFAKNPPQNLELLLRLEGLVELGYPLLVGTSRKSFIGDVLDLPVEDRLEGTAATVAWAVAKGARVVRVHDVEPMRRVVRMTEAILYGRSDAQ